MSGIAVAVILASALVIAICLMILLPKASGGPAATAAVVVPSDTPVVVAPDTPVVVTPSDTPMVVTATPMVTEPPMTEPPMTEPPMTEPPMTEPPMTEPPMTEAPMTETPTAAPWALPCSVTAPGDFGSCCLAKQRGGTVDLSCGLMPMPGVVVAGPECAGYSDGVACCVNKMAYGRNAGDGYCRNKSMDVPWGSWVCPGNGAARGACCERKAILNTARVDPVCNGSWPAGRMPWWRRYAGRPGGRPWPPRPWTPRPGTPRPWTPLPPAPTPAPSPTPGPTPTPGPSPPPIGDACVSRGPTGSYACCADKRRAGQADPSCAGVLGRPCSGASFKNACCDGKRSAGIADPSCARPATRPPKTPLPRPPKTPLPRPPKTPLPRPTKVPLPRPYSAGWLAQYKRDSPAMPYAD